MEDFYKDQKQKRNDLLKGILHNFIVGIVAGFIYFGILIFTATFDSQNVIRLVTIILASILFISLVYYEFKEIRKHLKGRRYIAIGMIVALVLPLLAFGACSQFFLIDMGWS
jgi:ACR3 family arsenite efflux pump ArsB